MRLLIGTTNPAKFKESSAVLTGEGIELLGLKDFPDVEIIAETGQTFEENAILKTRGYFSQTGIPCIADDGGLEVEYLNGAPGVASHRWLGHEATDIEKAHAILEHLKGIPKERRGARLGGFVAFFDGEHLVTSQNWVEGYIAEHPVGEIQPGFPYRAILMIPQFRKSYSELTEAEHEQVNFRRKNLNALKPEIIKFLRTQ